MRLERLVVGRDLVRDPERAESGLVGLRGALRDTPLAATAIIDQKLSATRP